MTSDQVLNAPVEWAQREDCVFVTVKLPDVKEEEVKIEEKSFTLTCMSAGKKYHTELNLHGDITPDECKQRKGGGDMFFYLKKKEDGYWPRLLNDKAKRAWLKVDFGKWKDEDESADEGVNMEGMQGMPGGMGGMPGGMGGMMGGMGGGGGGGDMDMASLQAMMAQMGGGGAGGAGGMPAGMDFEKMMADSKGMSGDADGDVDSDDDDLPELEEDAPAN